jgi:hypothetical protein
MDAWQREAARLLELVEGEPEVTRRIAALSRALVGRPYVAHPLGGGPDTPEKLTIALDRFDCVTFVESVLALARSRDPLGFARELKRVRYRQGRIGWRSRLHYFSDWLEENERAGRVRGRSRGPGARTVEVELSILPSFAPRRARLTLIPRATMRSALARFTEGAVVAFGSLRRGLDFFHVGLLVHDPGQPAGLRRLCVCHAAQSRGGVVLEPLTEFLGRNRVRGMALAAPRDLRRPRGARRP